MVSLSGTVSAGFQCHWLMSSGSLEPPCVKIFGGFSEPMHVRVFEPPADPEPPPGTVQSPFSVFQSAIVLPGASATSPSSSNTDGGVTAHATVAVARIAVAPRGAQNRLESKYGITRRGEGSCYPGGATKLPRRASQS